MTRQLTIGLDADGVLLNYNLAWGQSGVRLMARNPLALSRALTTQPPTGAPPHPRKGTPLLVSV